MKVSNTQDIMRDNESDYIRQMSEGSGLAFECLYNRYSGKLYHFIFKMTSGNTWQTEELVQRAFIRIWENREQINPGKSFFSYMCTIAKNMLLNELEHQMVEFIFQEQFKQDKTIDDYSTDKAIDLKFLDEIIDKLAEQLPYARKQVFLLRKQKDYSVREIAEALNLAETTVQTQLSKALIFMKEQLLKYYYLICLLLCVRIE